MYTGQVIASQGMYLLKEYIPHNIVAAYVWWLCGPVLGTTHELPLLRSRIRFLNC